MVNVLVVVSALLAIPLILIGLIWLFQERIAFQPPPRPHSKADVLEHVSYSAEDGQQLLSYIVGDPHSATGLLLSFHGNADLAVYGTDWAEQVVRVTGYAVMLAEYRGYMGLGGRPTYFTSQLDADAAYSFARDSFNIPPHHIAFYGHSLGSAIAVELASRHSPSALLLESPFSSARAMGQAFGWHVRYAWNAIARFHFDTVARVAEIDAPVFVIHGAKDRTIPSWMGEQVFAAAKTKGKMLIVPDASHNDVKAGAEYWDWVKSALKR